MHRLDELQASQTAMQTVFEPGIPLSLEQLWSAPVVRRTVLLDLLDW
jgi:hypothetical protein